MSSIGPSNPYQPPVQPSSSFASAKSSGADPLPNFRNPTAMAGAYLAAYGQELRDALNAYRAQQNPQTLQTLLVVLKVIENDLRDQGTLIDSIKYAQCSNPPPSVKDLGTALEAAYSCGNELVLAQACITNAMAVHKMPNPYELLDIIGTVTPTPDPNADAGTVWGDMQILNNCLAPTQNPPSYVPIPGTDASPQIQGDTPYQAASTVQSQSIANIQAAFAAYMADPRQGTNALLQKLIQADQDIRAYGDGLIQVLEAAAEGPNPDEPYYPQMGAPPPGSKIMGAIAQSYALASSIIAAENVLIIAGQKGVPPDMKAFAKILGSQNDSHLNTIWGSINSIVSWLQPPA